jgi:histone-lysine N-methyltransferase SETMAR
MYNVTVLQHPLYSPDLSLCDLFLFPQLKKKMLKGWQHENVEAIQVAATMELTAIPKGAFSSCFQDLPKRWKQCIHCTGDYSEGDMNH